jgi:hypothetical protein
LSPRLDRQAKANKILVERRVTITEVRGRYVSAWVRGDQASYEVVHDAGVWSCPCDCRQVCSHVLAVMAVTEPVRREAIR